VVHTQVCKCASVDNERVFSSRKESIVIINTVKQTPGTRLGKIFKIRLRSDSSVSSNSQIICMRRYSKSRRDESRGGFSIHEFIHERS
jgi:hypothetical protein